MKSMIKKPVIAISVMFASIIIYKIPFKIDATDRGYISRFGVPRKNVLTPGLHFKIPFVDEVDKIRVSMTTVHIQSFDVLTIDNQKVTLDINFNYTISDSKVYHLLYEVGKRGDSGIEEQIIPVVKDRAARVFSGVNMNTVNANRNIIQTNIEKDVIELTMGLFGIQAHSIQIAAITPSKSFMDSNEEAVKAKNAAVAAENTKKTKQFEADQFVIKAKGDADSAIEAARGRSESMLLEAQANKTRQVLEGEGLASRLAAEIKPFGTPEQYIAYLKAKAQLNWNGQQPQILAGGNSATNLVLPIKMDEKKD